MIKRKRLVLSLSLAMLTACSEGVGGGDAPTAERPNNLTKLLTAKPITEKPENGNSETVKDTLEIKGLTPGAYPFHFIIDGITPLEFKLVNAPQIDSIETQISVEGVDGTTNSSFDAKKYFKWDETNSTFTVSDADLKELYSKLPTYPFTLSFSFISPDREYSRMYEMTIQRAQHSLRQ